MSVISSDKIDALIEREGGEQYTNRPNDRGGPTRWGVTEQVARAYGYSGPMEQLPRATAVSIFTQRYYTGPGFEDIERMAPRLADRLFDIGVNMGTGTAVMFLQRSVNNLNHNAADWPDVAKDGAYGPMTRHALQRLLSKRGAQGEATLVEMVCAMYRVRAVEICERDPSQEENAYGWQQRASLAHGAANA